MKGKIAITGILVLLIPLVSSASAFAIPSCAFGGTVTGITGNVVQGTEVSAYFQSTGLLAGVGMQTSGGYALSIENADNEYVIFMVAGKTADQGPVLCDGNGQFTLLNLSVTDSDSDGYGQGGECDDSNISIHPPELNCSNGLDDDCDGFTDGADMECMDADGDGYSPPADFNDTDPTSYPGAPELCDGKDNDGDLGTDEGFNIGSACTSGIGACARTGVRVCSVDHLSSVCNATAGSPSDEVCGNDVDEDCDGSAASCGGGGGGGGGGSYVSSGSGSCTENWTCTDWSSCSNGLQTRSCNDTRKCGTTKNKPAENATCVIPNICEPGTRVCAGDNVMNCTGYSWEKIEMCADGCVDGVCKQPAVSAPDTENDPISGDLVTGLLFSPVGILASLLTVGVLAFLFFFVRRKKNNVTTSTASKKSFAPKA